MALTNKGMSRRNRCRLKGKYKQTGFNSWRFFCSGQNKVTGENKTLYLELSILNPSVSPEIPQFAFKKNTQISPSELQSVLTGTAMLEDSDRKIKSSYIRIRACILGMDSYQIAKYYPASAIGPLYKAFSISIGGCVFSEDLLTGTVSVSREDVIQHPEYMTDSGTVIWNLRYDTMISSGDQYKKRNFFWAPVALSAVFTGSFSLNGNEFQVVPNKSSGYIDSLFGSSLPIPWFCLASSNLISIISGRKLQNSCFAVQGINDDSLSILVNFPGNQISFLSDSGKKKSVTWECVQVPDDSGEEKLHWSVSVHNKIFVIDIDIFADASELCMCYSEPPANNGTIINVLTGGTASGEIRLYKQIKKSLELIEYAHIADAVCEYGVAEKTEK